MEKKLEFWIFNKVDMKKKGEKASTMIFFLNSQFKNFQNCLQHMKTSECNIWVDPSFSLVFSLSLSLSLYIYIERERERDK